MENASLSNGAKYCNEAKKLIYSIPSYSPENNENILKAVELFYESFYELKNSDNIEDIENFEEIKDILEGIPPELSLFHILKGDQLYCEAKLCKNSKSSDKFKDSQNNYEKSEKWIQLQINMLPQNLDC